MIKWLFELLIGWPWCWHKWKIINTSVLTGETFEGKAGAVGAVFHLQCERCGDVTHRKLK